MAAPAQAAKTPAAAPAPKVPPPPFKLEIDHKDVININWEKNAGSTFTDLKITNPFDEIHTFKIKCSGNKIFRVRSPMGSIDPKSSIDIRLIQHALELPAKPQSIEIAHMKCTAADAKKNNWRMVWRSDTKPEGIIRIPIAFVDPNPAPAPSPAPAAPVDPSLVAV